MAITSWYDGVSIGNRPNTAEWQETSGLAAPMRVENAGYIWAQSDGTINKIFPINISDGSDDGAWTLVGASPSDVEDLASANVGGQPYIYLADIGNNANSTNSRGSGIDLRVYRIKEPVVTGSTGNLTAGTDYETINCAYPGGDTPTHRDCETLLVDPDTGDMYFVMKRFTPTKVYRLAHAASYTGTQTLEALGTITTPPFTIGHDNANGGYYVAGTISPDGTEILLKGYEDVYLFTRDPDTQTIYEALQASLSPVRAYVSGGYPTKSPPMEPKGEGICYDYYGEDFYTASEYLASAGHSASNYPTYKYVRAIREAAEASLRQGLNGYAGAVDTYVWSNPANQNDNHGSDATFIADYDSGTSERYGLLKFDISSITAGSVIIGADLEIYIAVEGANFQLRKMYQTWNASSSYTSLGGLPAFDDVDASSTAIGGWTFGDWTNIDGADSIGSGAGTVGTIRIKIPADIVQGWLDGTITNQGFVFYGTTNTNGFQFASSEATTASQRPTLHVRYIPPLPAADEADESATKPTTAYPVGGGTRSALRTPVSYISGSGVNFDAARTISNGNSGYILRHVGSKVVGGDSGATNATANVSFPAIISLTDGKYVSRGAIDKDHSFTSDIGPLLLTSGWNWETGQLNDILEETIIGSELISNGSFASNLTGWTYTQTVTQSGGRASMPDDTFLYQSISVDPGKHYKFSVDIIGQEVGLYVLDSEMVGVVTSAHHGGGESLTHNIHFHSEDRTTMVIYIWSSSGGPNLIDNVSVKEIRHGLNSTFGTEVNRTTYLIGGNTFANKSF